MDTTSILFFLTAVISLIYFWCKHHYNYWQRKGVPHIEPTLLFGSTKDVFTFKTTPGLYLSNIYNDPKVANEPVVGIFVLHKPALLIREPEIVKSILIKDFNKFSNRYASCDPHKDALGAYTLFFVNNPHWKEFRTKISPVFTSGKIKQMYPLMLEIGSELETHLTKYSKTGNAFTTEIKEICALFTTDLIATIAFGIRSNALRNPNAEFRKQARQIFNFTLSRAVDFFVCFFLPKLAPLLRIKFFPPKFSKFMRDTIDYIIAERERTGTIRNDLIDIFVSMRKTVNLEETNNDNFSKNKDYMVAQASAFLAAGFETSSSTMSFALYELSRRPDLQKLLRAEILEALLEGNGKISYEKLTSMDYLGMVVDETLRMYPVLPFIEREYHQVKDESDFDLKPYLDYTLPTGLPVYIPLYAIQRDPKYWQDPDTFDPERFSSENRKFHHPMTYLPFGTGPRNCIGMRIGLLQARIGLVHFFKNHYVTTCEKTIPEMSFDKKALMLQCDGGIFLNVVNDQMYDIESKKQ